MISHLKEVPAEKFYTLALQLGMDQALKDNDANYPNDKRRAFNEMLRAWVDKDMSASWEILIKALQDIELNRIANKLKPTNQLL